MTQAQPLIETLPMTLGAPMSDEPGNPSTIEIPLKIELPNGQTLYAGVALGGLPFHGQQQIAERMATAWNAFAGVPTQNITPPAQCLHQIAEPAAPQSVQPSVPKGWKLVPVEIANHLRMGWAYLDAARKVSPSKKWEFSLDGYRAMLAAAPAHPSQGVPTQVEPFMWTIQEPDGSAYMDEGCVNSLRENLEAEVNGLNRGLDAEDGLYKVVPVYLAATQPAAQGLAPIAQAIRDYHYALDTRQHGDVAAGNALNAIQGVLGMHWKQGQEAEARAAQAKQGGA